MSEGETVRRGLYLLGYATTSELGAYANASNDQVLKALASRPGLLDGAHPRSGVWRYTPAGRDVVGSELADTRGRARADGAAAVERRLSGALDGLERDLGRLTADPQVADADEFGNLIDMRIRAVQKVIARSAAVGHDLPSISARLDATARGLRAFRERRP